jgi:PAT family beta-lactamase induction signal transducer AmpG
MMIAAVAGATQDIATDGVYITTLDTKRQAVYCGIQSLCWNIGQIITSGVLILLVGKLAGESKITGQPKPGPEAYSSAWMTVVIIVAAIIGAVAIWHSIMLPPGAKATDKAKGFGDAMATFGKAFATFFQKKDIWLLLGFAFFYRFGLGLLDKIAPLFLLDSRANGGLGLDNTRLGYLNGFIGTGAFMIGSILGGLFVAKRGLKKSLLILALALNVPNVTFLFLGLVRPEVAWTGGTIWPFGDGSPNAGLVLVGLIFFIEKLGWGFGAVGHMIYMMQKISPGPYRTAHYAFATGIGLSFCMTLTGMVSGYLQTSVGYTTYFVLVLCAAIPSILFTVLAPFHHTDGNDSAA